MDTFEEEEEIDIDEVKKEIEKIESKLKIVKEEMRGYLEEWGYEWNYNLIRSEDGKIRTWGKIGKWYYMAISKTDGWTFLGLPTSLLT